MMDKSIEAVSILTIVREALYNYDPKNEADRASVAPSDFATALDVALRLLEESKQ